MSRISPKLYELALEHEGLFTMAEAVDAGVSPRALVAAEGRGMIQRLSRGIYRLPHFPADPRRAQLWEAVLWPSPKRGVYGLGVISHLSALAEHYALLAYTPSVIDVTIPKSWRIRREPPAWLKLHHADLDETKDIDGVIDLPVTSFPRTIQDCIDAQVDRRLIVQVLDAATEREPLPAPLNAQLVEQFRKQLE